MMGLPGIGPHVGARASDLLDGRLSAAEENRLRLHIGSCRQCATEVHREQQVRAMLRTAAQEPPALRTDLLVGLISLAGDGPTADPRPSSTPRDAPRSAAHRRRAPVVAAVVGTFSIASLGAFAAVGTSAAQAGGASVRVSTTTVGTSVGTSVRTVQIDRSTRSSMAVVLAPAGALLRGAAMAGDQIGTHPRWSTP